MKSIKNNKPKKQELDPKEKEDVLNFTDELLDNYDKLLNKCKTDVDYYKLTLAVMTFKELILSDLRKEIELEDEYGSDEVIEVLEVEAKNLAVESLIKIAKITGN